MPGEERLEQLKGKSVLLLRPVSSFENFYEALELIKQEGINGDSVSSDLAVPMIATRDIADIAAKALRARDWQCSVVRELLGPRDLSFSEAARILGARIGKPDLKYMQFSYAEEAKALVQAGACPRALPGSTSRCPAPSTRDGSSRSEEGSPRSQLRTIRGLRQRTCSSIRGELSEVVPFAFDASCGWGSRPGLD